MKQRNVWLGSLVFVLIIIVASGCAEKKEFIGNSNNSPYTFVTSLDTPGWPLNLTINEDGDKLFMAVDEALFKIFNISDPENPHLYDTKIYNEYGFEFEDLLRIEDVYISERDTYLVVATSYQLGQIRSFNVTNPDSARQTEYAMTHSYINTIESGPENPYLFFATGSISLKYVFMETNEPGIPYPLYYQISALPLRNNGVFYKDNYCYIAASQQGLYIAELVDTSDVVFQHRLESISSIPVQDIAYSVYVEDNYAYVAAGYGGLEIFNIEDKTNPTRVGLLDFSGKGEKLVKIDNNILITAESYGVYVINVENPANPQYVGNIGAPYPNDIAYNEGYIYIADRDAGLLIYKE